MRSYKAETFAEVYAQSLHALLHNPSFQSEPRGMKVKEDLNVSLEITDPKFCMYLNPRRSTQQKYIAAEFCWYYLGRNDVEYIKPYAKMWDMIKNDDGTANSAYGNLIFNTKNEHGFNQYEWAYNSLVSDKDSRQAVLHFNLPKHQYEKNKDFVCTMYGNFHIRDEKLYLSIFMRSNDAVLGTPTDVAFFCSLQMQMLEHLRAFYPNLQLGSYTHVANSYHIYERHFDLVSEMLEQTFTPINIPSLRNSLILSNGQPTEELKWVDEYLHGDSKDALIFQNTDDILFWMLNAIKPVIPLVKETNEQ